MESGGVRRKACDLCYRKKIKCDGKKPLCSHCVTYASDCTYGCTSRKKKPRRKEPDKPEADQQDRVKFLEAHIKALEQKIEVMTSLSSGLQSIPAEMITPQSDEPIPPRAGPFSSSASANLPPQEEVLPIVEHYLTTSNSQLPLFHPRTLLSMVRAWYQEPHTRDPITWAAINIVLALGLQFDNPKSAANYAMHAQSMLTQVTTGQVTIVNVQILLGLVMFLYGIYDFGPPSMLIAIALRLAQQLGLHTRMSSQGLDPHLQLQRARVFWIAYILDRDISLRIRQAPIHQDDDIDLDLPGESASDEAGQVLAPDGQRRMNFFRARVLLARIEGRYYHLRYSVKAASASTDEQAKAMAAMRQQLDEWDSQVPHAFSPRALCEDEDDVSGLTRSFTMLFATRLTCMCVASQASTMNLMWIESLRNFGRTAIAGLGPSLTPLPTNWQTLVEDSRDFLKLFMGFKKRDSTFIWTALCGFGSGILCLTANNMCDPYHPSAEDDILLVESALRVMEAWTEEVNINWVSRVRDTCRELASHARYIVEHKQLPHIPIFNGLLVDGPFLNSFLLSKND
ncbi:fungal-specific transcription factor domain-containing protein [Stachybotrys elegans]|uniref:Fungal-specific transcription factor domain-containing protein n=1 Tax=Stachybotrys elegans TaxID=80388 RepID=A0A8K0SXE9_9HYPO|nr:fungal-specific transcription factor domain-containing protein [Stachybotrys elegans]